MKIAIVGATGLVGQEMLKDLAASQLPDSCELHLFASGRKQGRSLCFRDREIEVLPWKPAHTADCDYVLMSAGSGFAREYGRDLSRGVVIDNSSAWRMHPEVPLVIPEVNGQNLKPSPYIANPNCVVIQLLLSLAPLSCYGLDLLVLATYQAASGMGQKGLKALEGNLRDNILPGVGGDLIAGESEEERKIIGESQRILGKPLDILVRTARVPVARGHCLGVNVRLQQNVELEQVVGAWQAMGLHLGLEEPREIFDSPRVAVSRPALRRLDSGELWLSYWSVADNLKKGAATNAVQILDLLWQRKFKESLLG